MRLHSQGLVLAKLGQNSYCTVVAWQEWTEDSPRALSNNKTLPKNLEDDTLPSRHTADLVQPLLSRFRIGCSPPPPHNLPPPAFSGAAFMVQGLGVEG